MKNRFSVVQAAVLQNVLAVNFASTQMQGHPEILSLLEQDP